MAKKSSFAKKFPPIFIAGAVIGVLIVAYRYIFADRKNRTQNTQPIQDVPQIEVSSPSNTAPIAQIEHKNGE